MTLVLRWRAPERQIGTNWRGPEGMAEALKRDPAFPIAAIVGPPGPAGAVGAAGAAGPQGNPGPSGPGLEVGLATAISARNVPASASAIVSSGYSTHGIGAASYVNDASATAGLAAANPRVCKQSADGRYWRLLPGANGIDITHCGALGGYANDTAAIQAAVDYIKSTTGGTIWVPAGYFGCGDVVINGTQPVNFAGEGARSVLYSNTTNKFALRFETAFIQCKVSNLFVLGDAKNTHGIYVNTVANFTLEAVTVSGCGIGLCFNGTIDTHLTHLTCDQNYVGIYYTRRATDLTVGNVNGQTVTLTAANFLTHPGESTIVAPFINNNNFGVVIDQPDNSLDHASNLKTVGGLVQSNSGFGFLGIALGETYTNPSSFLGTWFESNGTAGTATFDGVTYTVLGDIYQGSGRVIVRDTTIEKATIKGTACLIGENCAILGLITKDATASAIFTNSAAWPGGDGETSYQITPLPIDSNNTALSKTRATAGYTNKFTPLSSNRLLHADALTYFGAGSDSNVADGVLDVRQCKEVTLSATSNGPILFTNPGGIVAGKYYVALFSIKWVSGGTSLNIQTTAGGAPFNFVDFTAPAQWTTFALMRRAAATDATSSSNFLSYTGTAPVVRLSALAHLEFDTVEQVKEFLDTNAFPVTAATSGIGETALLARANHTGTQTAATISDFNSAADARVTAGIATHEAAGDPHPNYLTPAEGNASYSLLGHAHTAANISDFNSATRAQVEAELIAGANVTITPAGSGESRTLTVAATGGGGGSPGGVSGEIQYNNAGAFAGAANVEVDTGNLKLVSTTDPAAPAGGLLLYSKLIAGRHLPKIIGPSGIDTVMQVGLHGNAVFMVGVASGTTAPTVWGGTLTTAATMSMQLTVASANPWLATQRKRFATTATAGNGSGMRTAYVQWFRGNAAGFGGFFFRTQIGQNLNVNGAQVFHGLCASTAVLASTAGAVGALLNMIGMGYDTTDSSAGNWQLFRNDGSGTATKVDLGATNAARNTTHGFDLIIYCPPGAATEIFVRIVNLHSGAVVLDTSYTTDLPAVNVGMAYKAEGNNGAVASAMNLEVAKVYIESDY